MYAASRTCRVLHRSAAEHREALATDPRQSRSTPWQPRARNVLIGSTPRRSKQLLRSRPVASEPSPASRFAPEGSGTAPRLLRSHVSHCRLESGQMSPLAQQTRAGDEAAGESEIGEPEVLYGPPGGCSAIGVCRHFQKCRAHPPTPVCGLLRLRPPNPPPPNFDPPRFSGIGPLPNPRSTASRSCSPRPTVPAPSNTIQPGRSHTRRVPFLREGRTMTLSLARHSLKCHLHVE